MRRRRVSAAATFCHVHVARRRAGAERRSTRRGRRRGTAAKAASASSFLPSPPPSRTHQALRAVRESGVTPTRAAPVAADAAVRAAAPFPANPARASRTLELPRRRMPPTTKTDAPSSPRGRRARPVRRGPSRVVTAQLRAALRSRGARAGGNKSEPRRASPRGRSPPTRRLSAGATAPPQARAGGWRREPVPQAPACFREVTTHPPSPRAAPGERCARRHARAFVERERDTRVAGEGPHIRRPRAAKMPTCSWWWRPRSRRTR